MHKYVYAIHEDVTYTRKCLVQNDVALNFRARLLSYHIPATQGPHMRYLLLSSGSSARLPVLEVAQPQCSAHFAVNSAAVSLERSAGRVCC